MSAAAPDEPKAQYAPSSERELRRARPLTKLFSKLDVDFDEYRKRTDRVIPVIVLAPR